MPSHRTLFALLVALVLSSGTAAAQRSPNQVDSVRAQIHTTLRAFYFNLAHHDWEALTADILAAKVVAHRPAPETFLMAAASVDRDDRPLPADPVACPSGATALVEQARIRLDGDWAEVSVPRCAVALAGADEFRLIHFQERWRLVYIDLFSESMNISADR